MTLCRKCGKEIPDGEELCEDCKNKESQMDEAYLEELMQNMSDEEKEPENAGEPAPVMDEQVEEKPAEEASDGEADVMIFWHCFRRIMKIMMSRIPQCSRRRRFKQQSLWMKVRLRLLFSGR